jgi:two-component system sensor histidine kinase BaeS
MGGQPLALRLALLLAAAVAVVLLVVGILVNRAVSRSLEETLTAAQEQRLALAAAALDDAMQREGPLAQRGIQQTLRAIARAVGGAATLTDDSGAVRATAGVVPPAVDSETFAESLPRGGTLKISVPRRTEGFLRAFNAALLIGGLASVVAIVAIGALVADRLTRPLRGVAAAASALGAGDLRARAVGGSDRESTELAAAFNTMADRLERSEMLRRRAASDVAHDLATPATVLESQLQAMVDGVVPADSAGLEAARASAAALSGVVRQLGDLATAEAASLQARPERIDLAALFGRVVAALDGMLRERSVTARVSGAATAVADPAHAERALRNVLTNAIQHSPPGGIVEVDLRPAAPWAEVRIRDQGPGIAAEDVPHVFERFYRADPARGAQPAPATPAPPTSGQAAARSTGSGIGLTIARELLAANGGTIEVESTSPGSGSTFLIRLPAPPSATR